MNDLTRREILRLLEAENNTRYADEERRGLHPDSPRQQMEARAKTGAKSRTARKGKPAPAGQGAWEF